MPLKPRQDQEEERKLPASTQTEGARLAGPCTEVKTIARNDHHLDEDDRGDTGRSRLAGAAQAPPLLLRGQGKFPLRSRGPQLVTKLNLDVAGR